MTTSSLDQRIASALSPTDDIASSDLSALLVGPTLPSPPPIRPLRKSAPRRSTLRCRLTRKQPGKQWRTQSSHVIA